MSSDESQTPQPTEQSAPAVPPTTQEFENDTLPAALARHGLELAPDRLPHVERYARLLWEWNDKLNLTRHTTFDKFVARDVRDTLEISKLLHQGEEVLDVGSGGGVPGLLLAIIRPDLQVTLSDSVGKKTMALESMVETLGVAATVHNVRSEDLLEDARFDALTIRAVGPLETMLRWFKPHWQMIGRLLILKGPKWKAEDLEARRVGLMRELNLKLVAEYPLYGTESNSVILKVWHHRRREK